MDITPKTRISKLIKFNPDVINAIASINQNFKKLKNPVLRKLLAPRVTIENAAKIGGVSVSDFIKNLIPLGFVYNEEAVENIENDENMSNTFDIIDQTIIELDVRPDLEQGNDPFGKIMEAIDKIGEGEILKLVNSFEPVPIINAIKQKGFTEMVENPSTGLFFVYFKRTSADNSDKNDEVAYNESLKGDFEEVYASFGGNCIELDVRDLEMPQPMVQILSKLNELPDNYCLYVHHKKIPQFLLPQLKERNYAFLTKEIDHGNVKMIIYKGR